MRLMTCGRGSFRNSLRIATRVLLLRSTNPAVVYRLRKNIGIRSCLTTVRTRVHSLLLRLKGIDMSVNHTNFYENLPEAQMRIRQTVVLYDGSPYYVIAITDHKGDGVFRVYLEPLADAGRGYKSVNQEIRNITGVYPASDNRLGPAIDEWLTKNKATTTILRKKMNSPLFAKFRPFPLGMLNTGESANGRCYYVERQPMRHREQGLTAAMLTEYPVSCGRDKTYNGLNSVSIYTEAFKDLVLGKYPSGKECLSALLDSDVTNEALAFHRLFAFIRGPLDQIFLGYKDEVVGVLPNDDLSMVRLGTRYRHLKESIQDLGLFGNVRT